MMFDDRLRPAGEAVVTFGSVEEAYRAIAENNKKPMMMAGGTGSSSSSCVVEISLV